MKYFNKSYTSKQQIFEGNVSDFFPEIDILIIQHVTLQEFMNSFNFLCSLLSSSTKCQDDLHFNHTHTVLIL